ncbi:peptidase M23, partial [Pseudomonas chlororaphis]
MTTEPPKAPPLYPKTHLLAASGIAALLSLALLVFPSSDVEAKRTTLSLDLESPVEQLTQDQDAADAVQATNEAVASPFAQIENSPEDTAKTAEAAQEQPAPAVVEEKKAANHREVIVAKGDTLSTLFEKVGLPATSVHDVLASDKQAKQFTQLKRGQKLEFELGPDGQLNNLHSKVNDLESITLTKGPKGFAFSRITAKPMVRTAYV